MIGTILDGRYRIERMLGEGGMGAVYEATHLGTDRRVAVKVIQQIALGDTDVFARFQREARASSAVDTKHIVEVLDSGRDPESGLPYMAMELLKGQDLGIHIEHRGALDCGLALRIVAQTCIGLSKAHQAHVVHRDIKPANIILAQEEDDELIAKVLDFGIAKVRPKSPLEGEGLALTQTGRLLGTPLYMSPEQAQGAKDIDARTDIWSLGAVLYEALTGKPPHDADNLGKLILAICGKPVAPPSTKVPTIPPEVDRIIGRSMAIEREDRYSTVDEMLEDLEKLLPDGYGIAAAELGQTTGEGVIRRSSRVKRRPTPMHSSTAKTVALAAASSGDATPARIPTPKDAQLDSRAIEEVGVASTMFATTSSPMGATTKKKRRMPFVIAGAVTLVAVSFGLWFGLRSRDQKTQPVAAASPTQNGVDATVSGSATATQVPLQTTSPTSSATTAPPTTSASTTATAPLASAKSTSSAKVPAGASAPRVGSAAPSATTPAHEKDFHF